MLSKLLYSLPINPSLEGIHIHHVTISIIEHVHIRREIGEISREVNTEKYAYSFHMNDIT
jgi:hypothetical protein